MPTQINYRVEYDCNRSAKTIEFTIPHADALVYNIPLSIGYGRILLAQTEDPAEDWFYEGHFPCDSGIELRFTNARKHKAKLILDVPQDCKLLVGGWVHSKADIVILYPVGSLCREPASKAAAIGSFQQLNLPVENATQLPL